MERQRQRRWKILKMVCDVKRTRLNELRNKARATGDSSGI